MSLVVPLGGDGGGGLAFIAGLWCTLAHLILGTLLPSITHSPINHTCGLLGSEASPPSLLLALQGHATDAPGAI